MPRIRRSDILARFRAMKAQGQPIIGAGAGTGISAKNEEAGGADLIVIYNSGRYRMAGRGSLAGMMPYGDANGVVVEMAREVLPIVARTPVLAGVCGTDPFRQMDVFLDEIVGLGFSGVQNFPTVGKFCTPLKPSRKISSRKTSIWRNGSVPQTPARTGVRPTTGRTSRAMSTTMPLASPNGIMPASDPRPAMR